MEPSSSCISRTQALNVLDLTAGLREDTRLNLRPCFHTNYSIKKRGEYEKEKSERKKIIWYIHFDQW